MGRLASVLGVVSLCFLLAGCPPANTTNGVLIVTIAPQAAVDAGARWALDGGAWHRSGDRLEVPPNDKHGGQGDPHTVTFNTLTGWAGPDALTVLIEEGETTAIAGTYTSLAETGALMVSIEPEAARKAYAQWRVDDGTWHLSGETVLGIAVGTHLVSFSEAPAKPGFIKPLSVSVDIGTDPTIVLTGTYTPLLASDDLVAMAYNDLGMHCMNQDFSEFMILPPFNNLFATVIDRSGPKPRFVQDGIAIRYEFPSNTTSVDKTNFWDFAQDIFELDDPLPPDTGLTGNGLTGTMTPLADMDRSDWSATGIPLTPQTDDGTENCFQLALVTVSRNGADLTQTEAVTPVSWEINCQLCHTTPGKTVGQDILDKHDQLHGTTIGFDTRKPVACGACHPQPELGFEGDEGMMSLSYSMHNAHAKRMWRVPMLDISCYACHPGGQTRCLRDVHSLAGMNCMDCHGSMTDVANPNRMPWQDEPRCGDCHQREGFDFEQPGTLFRNSKGHYGVHCEACHGSPHAIAPTAQPADNVQPMALQGREGPIKDCTVCHSDPVDALAFEHRNIVPTS